MPCWFSHAAYDQFDAACSVRTGCRLSQSVATFQGTLGGLALIVNGAMEEGNVPSGQPIRIRIGPLWIYRRTMTTTFRLFRLGLRPKIQFNFRYVRISFCFPMRAQHSTAQHSTAQHEYIPSRSGLSTTLTITYASTRRLRRVVERRNKTS